jgi:hypothetical protein
MSDQARVVGVAAARTPGATLSAVYVTDALARAGERALLVELDPAGGSLAAWLQPAAGSGLGRSAIVAGTAPGPGALAEEIHRVGALAAIPGVHPLDRVRPDPAAVIASAGQLADWLVLDLGRVPGEAMDIARACGTLLLVVRPDRVSTVAARLAMRGFDPDRFDDVKLVMNPLARSHPDRRELEQALLLSVGAVVPFAPDEVAESIRQHAPVPGRLSKAFGELAGRLVAEAKGLPAPAARTRLRWRPREAGEASW